MSSKPYASVLRWPWTLCAAWGLRIAAAGLLACTAWTAQAGSWEVQGPQGQTVRLLQDTRSREGYLLVRENADGSPDLRFGNQGSTLFTLGPDNDGPASLRRDSAGRLWVAGASLRPGEVLDAVVLRFDPQGRPDASYAQGGRSATAPVGQHARALDLAPQRDGSAYVVGLLTNAQGQERSGLWRLRPDGSIDPRFGQGGAWADSGPGHTQPLEVAAADDGSVALLQRRGNAHGQQQLELWAVAPHTSLPAQLATLADFHNPALSWRAGPKGQGHWGVVDAASRRALDTSAATTPAGAMPALVASEAAALERPATAAELSLPYTAAASAPRADAAATLSSPAAGAWAAGLALAAAAAGWWGWRKYRHQAATAQAPRAGAWPLARRPAKAGANAGGKAQAPAGANDADDPPWP